MTLHQKACLYQNINKTKHKKAPENKIYLALFKN
jgi:hypothetical protein